MDNYLNYVSSKHIVLVLCFLILLIGIVYIIIKYLTKNTIKLYISLTTIPERLIDPWFLTNLKRLMNLNGNYMVVLNIPYYFKRTGEKYIIPQKIKELETKNLIINRLDTDYGPLTKLYGSLLNNNISNDSAILVCDDDIVYKSNFVVNIYREYLKDKTKFYNYCYNRVEGFKGYMFQKNILKPILKIKRPESCFRIDDNFIEESLQLLNIKSVAVSYGKDTSWTCTMDKVETDTHPKWSELNHDERTPMIVQCRREINILNNKHTIPKIIHQTYPTKEVSKEIQENIHTLKQLNPGYQYHLYDDNDIINFIKENYDDYILETYKKINPDYGPARTDYFRYLLLYKKGGIYLDIKSSCEKPFDLIIKNKDEYILTHWGNRGGLYNHRVAYRSDILNNEYGEFCNWNIIIKQNHPLMKQIIDRVTYNINNYHINQYGTGKLGVLYLTGPIVYSQVILQNLNNYDVTIYDNYYDIGLVYDRIVNHERLFKKHYEQLTTPIVLR